MSTANTVASTHLIEFRQQSTLRTKNFRCEFNPHRIADVRIICSRYE